MLPWTRELPPTMSYQAKRSLVSTTFLALGTTFELVSELAPELEQEIADWEEGRVVGMGVLPQGPAMSVRKTGGRFRFLGSGLREPTISILFKNVDSAVLVFTGQLGAHTASIQNRVIVRGNITHAMQAMRAMNIVQKFLLPGLMLRRTFKRPPRLTPAEMWIKTRVMAGLAPRILLHAAR